MKGIKVSKPGKDVSSTDPKDFTLHSQYNILKVVKEGSGTASIGDTTYEWSSDITHDLGYRPQMFFYFQHPQTERWIWTPGVADTNSVGASVDREISGAISHVSVDVVRMTLQSTPWAPSFPISVKYKYFILVEPREDAWYE